MIVPILALAYLVMFYVATNAYGGPWTSDYAFHLDVVQRWLLGENPLLSPSTVNDFPYSPLFHTTIAFVSKLIGIAPEAIFSFLQVSFLSTTIITLYWYVCRYKGDGVATNTVLLSLAGFALWDRPSQPIPNALGMILLPLMFHGYLQRRTRLFTLTSLALVYNHLFYGLFPIAGLYLYTLYKRENTKPFLWVAIGLLPLAAIMLPYWREILVFPSRNEYNVAQYIHFKENPFWGAAYLGYPLLIAGLYGVYKATQGLRSRFDTMALLWIASYIPLLIKFPHRALTFLAPPLAILGATALPQTRWVRGILTAIVAMYFLVELAFLFTAFRVTPIDQLFQVLIGWTEAS